MNKMQKIAIIGAGNMGSGIAQKYASSNFLVTLIDKNNENLKNSSNSIDATLTEAVSKNIFSINKAKEIKNNIIFSSNINDTRENTLIIEAIYEDLSLKQNLFLELENVINKDTILASNTSSFLIKDLKRNLKYGERVVGLHYFYHPAKNRLVELITDNNTNKDVLSYIENLQENIGKIVIKAKDSPGFIVNRFFVPWLNEATRLVESGLGNIATVEHAAKKFFNIPMGPFELMNITGINVCYHSCMSLSKNLGPFYAPSNLLEKSLNNGPWKLNENIEFKNLEAIFYKLLNVVSNIVCQMVFLEEVSGINEVDLSARVGLLWPLGPFGLTNKYLNKNLLNANPSNNNSILKQRIENNNQFLTSNVITHIKDDIAILTINKPDKLNALDETLLLDLEKSFSLAQKDDKINGIVITGHKKAFMAGADLNFFNEKIAQNDIEKILSFTKKAQNIFYIIDQCKKPVVAAISGLALGGGLELALACDYVVASDNVRLGFPECGIGIYPALQGTQRTARKIGIELAKYLILSATVIDGKTALDMGLIETLVEEKELLNKALDFAQNKPYIKKVNKEKFAYIIELFKKPLNVLLKEEPLNSEEQKVMQKIKNNAPLALKAADYLISEWERFHTYEALQALELEKITEIFESQDAKIGLLNATKKIATTFSGK